MLDLMTVISEKNKKFFKKLSLFVIALFLGLTLTGRFEGVSAQRTDPTTLIVKIAGTSHAIGVSSSTDSAVAGGSRWQVTASPEYKSVGSLVSFSTFANQSDVASSSFGSSFILSKVSASAQWAGGGKTSTQYDKLKSLVGTPATGSMFPDDSSLNSNSVSNASKTKGGNVLALTFPGWAFSNQSWKTSSKKLVANDDDSSPDWFSNLDESDNAANVQGTMIPDMNSIMLSIYNHMNTASQNNFDNNANAATANLALLVGSGWGHVGSSNNVKVNSSGQFTGAGLTRGKLTVDGSKVYIQWSGSDGSPHLYGMTKGPSDTYSGTWHADVKYVTWSTIALEADSSLYSTAGTGLSAGASSDESNSITSNEVGDTFKQAANSLTGTFKLSTAQELVFNYGGTQNSLITSDQFHFVNILSFITGSIGIMLLFVSGFVTFFQGSRAIAQGGMERTSEIWKKIFNILKYIALIVFWMVGMLIVVNILVKVMWLLFSWLPAAAQNDIDGSLGKSSASGFWSWLPMMLFWVAGLIPSAYYLFRSIEFMLWTIVGPLMIASDGLKGTTDFSNSNASKIIQRIIPLLLTQVFQGIFYDIIINAFNSNGFVNLISSFFVVFLVDKFLSGLGFSSGSFFGTKGFKDMASQAKNSNFAQAMMSTYGTMKHTKDFISGNHGADNFSAKQAMSEMGQNALANGQSTVSLANGKTVSAKALAHMSDPALNSSEARQQRREAMSAIKDDQHVQETRAMANQARLAAQKAGGPNTKTGRALAHTADMLSNDADESEQFMREGKHGLFGVKSLKANLPRRAASGMIKAALVRSDMNSGNRIKNVAGTTGLAYAKNLAPLSGSSAMISSALASGDTNKMLDALKATGGMKDMPDKPTNSQMASELMKRQKSMDDSKPVVSSTMNGLGASVGGAMASALAPHLDTNQKIKSNPDVKVANDSARPQGIFKSMRNAALDQEAHLAKTPTQMAGFAATKIDQIKAAATKQIANAQQVFQRSITQAQTIALTTAIQNAANNSNVTISGRSVKDLANILAKSPNKDVMHQDQAFNNLSKAMKNVADTAMTNANKNPEIKEMREKQLSTLKGIQRNMNDSSKAMRETYKKQFDTFDSYQKKYGNNTMAAIKEQYQKNAPKAPVTNIKTSNVTNNITNKVSAQQASGNSGNNSQPLPPITPSATTNPKNA